MTFNTNDIIAMLPHRLPFLFVDKVVDCQPGERAVGIKNVTINEPFFQGHFPTEPIFPGVLILEVIAQVTAIMYASAYLGSAEERDGSIGEVAGRKIAERIGYLVEIKSVKFLKIVRPGDTLRVSVEKKLTFGSLTTVSAEVTVDGEQVAYGRITVSEKP